MTYRHLGKTWGGCNKVALPLGRVCGATPSARSAYMASEDENLLAYLTAQAWREDPTPLSVEKRGRGDE